MSAVIPFEFDGRQIRTIETESGLLVVAKDVAEALGYVWNGSATIAHVPEEWRGVTSVLTPRGHQEMATLSEQGLYFFLGRSDKPGALPMQKWVAGEVLPSIRRTGAYVAPARGAQANQMSIVAKTLLMIGKAVSAVRGVKPEVAMSLTLDAIEKETGLPASSMRLALPGAAVSEAEKLNPTQLGERLGGKKARAVNIALAALGLQSKDAREGWVLTEAGAKHGQMVPFTKHGHSGYQPLWHESVIGPLQEYFAAGGGDNVVPIGA